MPHKSVNGIPSVTEVLGVIDKPFLKYWYAKNGLKKCEAIKEKSQKFGTKVHSEIQRLLENKTQKTKNKEIGTMLSSFRATFVEPFKVVPICVEPNEPLIDQFNGYSGTFDAVIKIECDKYTGYCIADWKTNNQVDNTFWPLQLAAYANLWNLHNTEYIDNGLIVRLDKKSLDVDPPIIYTGLHHYFEIFLSARRIWDYTHKKGLWEKQC